MKYGWIWCLINTILIGLCALGIGLKNSCESAQDQTIRDMMVELQAVKSCKANSDTIIVNINNDVKIPSHYDISIDYPAEDAYYFDTNEDHD